MTNTQKIYIDQFGNHIWASTRKELVSKAGGGKVSPMYCGKKDGSTVRVGYVVGKRWFTAFTPFEEKVSV